MEFEDIIINQGLEKALKLLFPNLGGIDQSNVIYNKALEQSNPIAYMTADIDGDWYFGIGSMPMIFKAVSNINEDLELNMLLLSNQISIDDRYNEKGHNNIDFWNGNGFKIEKTTINGVIVILITNASVVPKSSKTFNSTDLAKPIKENLEWIEGFDIVYDAETISKENKSLSNFINVPVLFKENIDYILISVQTIELAKIIIDRIMLNNGGPHSFELENLTDHKEWTYTFKGYAFVVGYLPESRVVRANRLKDNTKEGDNILSTNIHPLSKKLVSCIGGFNNQLFLGDQAASGDGRFFTKDEDASVIVAFFDSPSKAIKIFKDVVVSYNNNDEFLSINDGSVVKLFNQEPEDVITFDVENKFRLDLSKGNSYYRLNLYPPGGIYGSWDDLNEDEFNGKTPEVQFSQFSQELITKPITENTMNEEKDNEEAEKQEKEAFLEESVISPDEVTPASNQSRESSNSFFWNLLWILLAIFMISLLFRQCNPNQNYFEKGVNYFEDGNSDKGFKYLDKAIKKDNQHIEALMRRGREYINAEEYQNAEYDFSGVIALDPNNWEAYYLRGRSYMGQAHNKWSPLYKKAIDDFTTSIGLEPNSLNADSYYLRGEAKEISQGEKAGCADFLAACDLGHKEGCFKYDDLCYPETGFNPYAKYFGDGIQTGKNTIEFDNSNSKFDILVLLVNKRNNIKVRTEFIRKGENIDINNIPDGSYILRTFEGNDWTFEALMDDGITRGGFTTNQSILEYNNLQSTNLEWNPYMISNPRITFYAPEGGVKGKDIDFNKFMR